MRQGLRIEAQVTESEWEKRRARRQGREVLRLGGIRCDVHHCNVK